MPTAQLKSFAEKSGKPLADLERYWDSAKADAAEKFKHGSKKFWAYVVGIVKKRAGLSEQLTFKDFIALREDFEIDEDLKRKTTVQLEKGLTYKEALAACPWKKSYGDCRAFSYDAKTGEATWV